MLRLFDPVIYSDSEKQYVRTVLIPGNSDAWKSQTNRTIEIKGHISEHTIIAQGGRCAYCERMLAKGEVEIDHIANKGRYGQFSFEPSNLVTSCTSCNSPVNKGETDTIVAPANRRDYLANSFYMVHPYFDIPDEHIKYQDDRRTFFDWERCSDKGKFTIKMFNWHELWAYEKRVEIAGSRHLSRDILKVVAEIAVYKRKL